MSNVSVSLSMAGRLARFCRESFVYDFRCYSARTPICGPMIDFWWCFIVPRGFLRFFAEVEFPNCNGFWPVLILRLWNFVLSSSVDFVEWLVCGLINQKMCVGVAPELQLQVIRIVGVEVWLWTAFSAAIVGSACYSSPVSESRRLPGGCSRTCNVCVLS